MPSDTLIDLDAFFAQSVPHELCSLAAYLGTSLEQRQDSVWQGSGYGSLIESLIQSPDTAVAQRVEVERVIAECDLAGAVTVSENNTIQAYNHDIVIDETGVTLA